MEEVKLIRNEMKDRVQKLITQKDTSDGKANLAKLRHGIGKKPGEMPELSHHIRGLVQLFKAKSVKLDYIRLAEDLYWFQDTNKRKNVQLKWGEDFYREKGEDLS